MGTMIVNGRYEVLSELGRGGMGIVYRANQRSLNRVVAIKMLSRELAGDSEFRHRFQQEAQVIARLQHDNIVSVYDIEADRGTFFIIMEFVEGISLQEFLRDNGRLPFDKAAKIIAQVARALGYAHSKGIIHRDIKPDNIMIVGENQKAMVMDFGIARVADSTLKTQTGISMGTPKYMSPEQARGQHVDARSDLYSLGVVLYAALTGELPFDGDSPFTIALKHMQEPPPSPCERVPDLPIAFEEIVLRAMAKSPASRFQSGEEFAAALEAASTAGNEIRAHAVVDVTETRAEPTPRPLDSSEEKVEWKEESPAVESVETLEKAASVPAGGGRKKWMGLAAAALLLLAAVAVMWSLRDGKGESDIVARNDLRGAAVSSPEPVTPRPTATETPVPTPTRTPLPEIHAFSGEMRWGSAENPAVKAIQELEKIKRAYEEELSASNGKALSDDFVEKQSTGLAAVVKTLSGLQSGAQGGNKIAGIGLQNVRKEMDAFKKSLLQQSSAEANRLFALALAKAPGEGESFLK